jgi:predicted metal-binding membrane protein
LDRARFRLTAKREPLSEADPDVVDRFSWRRSTTLLGRAPLSLLVSLVALTSAAWALTLYHTFSTSMPMGIVVRGGVSAEGMGGMAMGGMAAAGWSLGGAVLFAAIWTVMMAAMMLPAAAPMILIFASAQARRERAVAVPTWIFTAGYILVWLGAGLLVYGLVQVGSEMATRLATADRASWAPLALGATLVAAGLYQFTPIKRICLTHCRSPFAFVAQHWRDGRFGALRMGLRHGVYCLGCCWALFAVLVAAGVMSLAWMLLLTLIAFVEKVLPQGRSAAAVIGGVLVILGVVVASGALSMGWIV